ncbi:hypothetical protein RyT2_02520 [Pseudolactococcus yaeyamensis]
MRQAAKATAKPVATKIVRVFLKVKVVIVIKSSYKYDCTILDVVSKIQIFVGMLEVTPILEFG